MFFVVHGLNFQPMDSSQKIGACYKGPEPPSDDDDDDDDDDDVSCVKS